MRADRLVLRDASDVLADAGLTASITVRDLGSGRELALDPDAAYPLASVVKLPLALAILRAAREGDVDLGEPVPIDPSNRTPGLTGLCRFEHPTSVAVEDLLYLAMCASDDTAADALFRLQSPARVTEVLRALGIAEITVRHSIQDLHETLAARLEPDELPQALALAIQASTRGGGHLIPQLDVTHANSGTSRAVVDLLDRIWQDPALGDEREPVRRLLGMNLMRHRLAPDLESDDAAWFSKTGTFLHLRHEVGVLEHADGARIAIAVLSESSVPARVQPGAEQALGFAARLLHDHVRATRVAR
ncbi:serine hydrolase [Agromyces salentinus]|uniref:Beta-lactamase n=1 Tax=Agromyces salentinus TaxID=269421 RepID=A0ABN2MQU5_9MICO|nr:serine hydrolase [Agromyces salentinus]